MSRNGKWRQDQLDKMFWKQKEKEARAAPACSKGFEFGTSGVASEWYRDIIHCATRNRPSVIPQGSNREADLLDNSLNAVQTAW
jgi:hypothetical protein